MTVSSVINGLRLMTQDVGNRGVASVMLANVRMQSHEVTRWVQAKGPFRELADTLDHYVRNDEQGARSLLQYAAGERSNTILWNIGRSTTAAKSVERISKMPGNAKALLRIIDAVDQAQPNLISVKPGRFVRSIGDKGELKWAEIDRDYQLAERPVSYSQFLPLAQVVGFPSPPARGKNVHAADPIRNVSQNLVEEWIRILNFLSQSHYRLPKEKEWERGTAKNLRIVDLAEEAKTRDMPVEDLLDVHWSRRYANAFLTDPRNPLNLGAQIFNDTEKVLRFLRDGLAVSAWDFSQSAEDTQRWENVYEHVTIGTERPDMARHIGYRYFVHREALRKEGFSLEDPMNSAFRLATYGLPPESAPTSYRRRK